SDVRGCALRHLHARSRHSGLRDGNECHFDSGASVITRLRRWWRLRRSGQVHVAPKGVRGRVYQKIDDPRPPTAVVQPKVTMRARVTRANGDIEDIGVIDRSG